MVCDEARIGWLARSGLDRHRPLLLALQFSLFVIGVLFWLDATTSDQGFSDSTWGALAYSIPAVIWAFANMAASSMCIIGLVRPIKRWMVAAGSGFHCLQLFVLSYSAVFTGGTVVVGLYASIFFLPLHLWILLEASRRVR